MMEDESELLQTCRNNLHMVQAAQEQAVARDNLWNQHRKVQRMLQRSRYRFAFVQRVVVSRMTGPPDLGTQRLGPGFALTAVALHHCVAPSPCHCFSGPLCQCVNVSLPACVTLSLCLGVRSMEEKLKLLAENKKVLKELLELADSMQAHHTVSPVLPCRRAQEGRSQLPQVWETCGSVPHRATELSCAEPLISLPGNEASSGASEAET